MIETRIEMHTQNMRKALSLSLFAFTIAMVMIAPARAQQTDRAKELGKRVLCMCGGCNQVLSECNHIGCGSRDAMIKELDDRVARNEPDDLTLQAFVQEYGIAVLAQPASKGFGLTAWLMPYVLVLIGAGIIWMVVGRWRKRAALPALGRKVSPEMLERVRRELDRQE